MSSSKKELVQVSSYSRRLKDNVKSILENYGEILRTSKITEGQRVTESQVAHVENEIEVRAANIVRAAEALSKLVLELKESLILNDFSSINEATTRRTTELELLQKQQLQQLRALYETSGEEGADRTSGTATGGLGRTSGISTGGPGRAGSVASGGPGRTSGIASGGPGRTSGIASGGAGRTSGTATGGPGRTSSLGSGGTGRTSGTAIGGAGRTSGTAIGGAGRTGSVASGGTGRPSQHL